MKKIIRQFTVALLLTGILVIPSHAITTGRWDFEAGYRYAQKVAEELAQEQESEPEEEAPEISQSQLDMLCKAIAEQTRSAKVFWKNYWNRGH